MASNIDITKPVQGNATTQSVRDNFASAKSEIEALQNDVANIAPDLVSDTTPQLGGTLDANGNNIDMGINLITDVKVGQWDTSYSWGDHSTEGYLTSETDPTVPSHVKSITTTDISNWNNANGQGVPAGGTAGQVLSKIDGTNYNTEWVDQGGGFENGQSITVGSLTVTNEIVEQQYSLTGTLIDPSNGTIQYKTLAANTTFTENLSDGEYVLLLINSGTFTVTWPTAKWPGGIAPTLDTSGDNAVLLFHVNGSLYGSFINA